MRLGSWFYFLMCKVIFQTHSFNNCFVDWPHWPSVAIPIISDVGHWFSIISYFVGLLLGDSMTLVPSYIFPLSTDQCMNINCTKKIVQTKFYKEIEKRIMREAEAIPTQKTTRQILDIKCLIEGQTLAVLYSWPCLSSCSYLEVYAPPPLFLFIHLTDQK